MTKIIQTIIVTVDTTRGMFSSESQLLDANLLVEEYVQQFLNAKQITKAEDVRSWTIRCAYHHDNTAGSPDPDA